MEKNNIKLKHKYIHYKNKQVYIPINFCKIQEDDIWVDAVIYKASDESLYVRNKKEFFNKFSLQN